MNISYNWLRDLIDLELSPSETADALTSVGLAVEGISAAGVDSIFDIDLTSNRPDCLSHRGVARELSAVVDRPLKITFAGAPEPVGDGSSLVTVEDPAGCQRFTARVISGVKVGPSPEWLVDRLESIGERSINNVADITNYVMHELGQPMHAFDLARLAGRRIIVRRAKTGEKITTLDGTDRDLDPSILAICDAESPVAIAGIMGGENSSISESTTDVLLEVAYFDRPLIRRGSRKLGLATEASYRFERGVDIAALIEASDRAATLIIDVAGGTIGELIDHYPQPVEASRIAVDDLAASVRRLTGQTSSVDECNRILARLGIGFESSDVGYNYVVPTWRHDLRIEEDLVEEVARHLGYATIVEEVAVGSQSGEYQASELRERRVRSALRDNGFAEAITYSFIDRKHDETYEVVPGLLDPSLRSGTEGLVTLKDSVIEGAVRMRPTLIPGLVDSIRSNLNHQQRDVKLFEIGRIFAAANTEDGLPNEQRSIGIALTGSLVFEDRLSRERLLDFYDIKGAVETICSAMGLSASFAKAEIRHLRPGQAAEVIVGDRVVGFCGRLIDRIAAGYKFKQPVYVAELNLALLLASQEIPVVYEPVSRFPSITRDVTLPVSRSTTYEMVRKAVLEQQVDILRDVGFVELYENADSGERSLTIRLTYRSDERTLLEADVEQAHRGIIDRVSERLGIELAA